MNLKTVLAIAASILLAACQKEYALCETKYQPECDKIIKNLATEPPVIHTPQILPNVVQQEEVMDTASEVEVIDMDELIQLPTSRKVKPVEKQSKPKDEVIDKNISKDDLL